MPGNSLNHFRPGTASKTRRASAGRARESAAPCKKRIGQRTLAAYWTGLLAKPLNPNCRPPQKTSSSAPGNEGTPIAAKRFRTVASILSNTASAMIASGWTPQLWTARSTAAAPMEIP